LTKKGGGGRFVFALRHRPTSAGGAAERKKSPFCHRPGAGRQSRTGPPKGVFFFHQSVGPRNTSGDGSTRRRRGAKMSRPGAAQRGHTGEFDMRQPLPAHGFMGTILGRDPRQAAWRRAVKFDSFRTLPSSGRQREVANSTGTISQLSWVAGGPRWGGGGCRHKKTRAPACFDGGSLGRAAVNDNGGGRPGGGWGPDWDKGGSHNNRSSRGQT